MLWTCLKLFGVLIIWAMGSSLTGLAKTPARDPAPAAIRAAEARGLQIRLDLDRRIEPHIFTLDAPMRLVVDLNGAQWGLTRPPAVEGPLGSWRLGRRDAGTARMILDLGKPMRVARVGYVVTASAREGAALVIDLEAASQDAFASAAAPWQRSSELLAHVYTPPEAARRAAPPRASAPPPEPPSVSLAAMAPVAVPRPTQPGRGARRVIVLDPGHGGIDPGAIGVTGVKEKDVTLAVARELERSLEATGRYDVHLTREGDHYLRLRERIERARILRAELLVSVHADSIGSSQTRGASVYTLSTTASDAEAAALAARENRSDILAGVDLSHESAEVANILIDLAQRDTMNQSAVFAGHLVRELAREIHMLPVRPHRFAGFAVLKAPDIPSALLELGYLSNREDEALLAQPAHRRRVVAGVVRAIDAYFAGDTRRR